MEKGIDYSTYNMSLKEYIRYTIMGCIILSVISYVFYNTFIVVFFMLPALVSYYSKVKKKLCVKRKQQLLLQFKSLCQSISAQLMSGYSIENSISEVYKEMILMYGKNSCICVELKQIMSKLRINIPIEKCFRDFAVRSDLEDIILFADIMVIAKKNGGDFIEIIKSASDNITGKIDINRDIQSIMEGKRHEQMIMNIVPLFIVMYVKITSPDMINVMYSSYLGKIIMTICLVIYVSALYIGKKITDIKV